MTDPAEPDNYRISEVPIYADCLADALSHDPVNAAGDDLGPMGLIDGNVAGSFIHLIDRRH